MKYGEWQPMETAPKDGTAILAVCNHEADPYMEDGGARLTVYGAHAEGSTHVHDGIHVLEWGDEVDRLYSLPLLHRCRQLCRERVQEDGDGLDLIEIVHRLEGGVMFVNLETDMGTLQFVAYNEHNGYYGHEAKVQCTKLTHAEHL